MDDEVGKSMLQLLQVRFFFPFIALPCVAFPCSALPFLALPFISFPSSL